MPQFNAKASVTITCGTNGASIYFTTDGSTPGTNKNKYSTSFTLYKNATVKAIGIKSGLVDSDVVTYEITVKLPTPELSSSVNGDQATVKLSNATQYVSGYGTVKYYYTTNGEDPTEDDTELTADGAVITSNCTVKVRAFATNNVASDVGSVTLSTLKVKTPVISAV